MTLTEMNDIVVFIGNSVSLVILVLFAVGLFFVIRFLLNVSKHEKEEAERRKKNDELTEEVRTKELEQLMKK
ncbi:MAG: hypothetical protein HUJ72_09985 [Blautia sp.]|nr:hypothetical protein [Blautia sp.]